MQDTTELSGNPVQAGGLATSAYSGPCTSEAIMEASGAQRAFAASFDTFTVYISWAIA